MSLHAESDFQDGMASSMLSVLDIAVSDGVWPLVWNSKDVKISAYTGNFE